MTDRTRANGTGAAASTDAAGRDAPAAMDERELIRRVAERVWQLWREELRLERERRGRSLRR